MNFEAIFGQREMELPEFSQWLEHFAISISLATIITLQILLVAETAGAEAAQGLMEVVNWSIFALVIYAFYPPVKTILILSGSIVDQLKNRGSASDGGGLQ